MLFRSIGADAVGIRVSAGRLTLIALDHVVTLDIPGSGALSGDRGPTDTGPALRHLLADLADTDTDLRFVLAGGTVAEGRLLWIGEDLVAVTTVLDPGPGTGYIRLCSVIEVSLSVSG